MAGGGIPKKRVGYAENRDVTMNLTKKLTNEATIARGKFYPVKIFTPNQ